MDISGHNKIFLIASLTIIFRGKWEISPTSWHAICRFNGCLLTNSVKFKGHFCAILRLRAGIVLQHRFCSPKDELFLHPFLTQMPPKIMLKKLHRSYAKFFGGTGKDSCFLRFHNGISNMFVNTGEVKRYFIFLVMLPKLAHTGWKFQRN